ncbi:MAG: MBL fold metallo-hydrolase [Flavobacteriia bacterium]|nr:MBL fold metallo-hydrolase [Flavobacteriia bacterium]
MTILGSGTSQGVPVIACDCHVCNSNNQKDIRLRSSVLLSFTNDNYVIDSGPDFRQQMLQHHVKSLRGIIFTHEHKDHVAGLDDVRAFNYREKRDMEVFCTEQVSLALHREFQYVFSGVRYPGIPKINLNIIQNEEFQLPSGINVLPIQVLHYKMPVLGFRIGNFTYITDAKTISEQEIDKIIGTEILIVNALHQSEHISHFNLAEALEFVDKIKPKKAFLTHISHLFGTYNEISNLLPENVFPAFDGLILEGKY